jgi:hypothetical protein
MKIINKDLSLNKRFFTINGVEYEIIGTESKIKGKIYDCIDTVRNNKSKEIKKYRRADLNIMLYKFNKL